jgi:septal ring factor EnvC (AmiA/AmiB activator)
MTKTFGKTLKWVVLLSFSASLTILGCARHPNEQELQALAQAQQAANAAEQALRDCNNEKASLENQLSQKKRDLQQAEDEKQAVSARLANWDN